MPGNPYAIDFSQAIEPAFKGMQAMSQMENQKSEAAYRQVHTEQLQQQMQEQKKKDAFLDSYVDITQTPEFKNAAPETQKTFMEATKGKGKDLPGGGRALTHRAIADFGKEVSSNVELFDKLAKSETERSQANLFSAQVEAQKAEKAFEKDPENLSNKQKYGEAQQALKDTTAKYQKSIATTAKGRDMVEINMEMKGMKDAGIWDRLPKNIQDEYTAAVQSGDRKRLDQVIIAHAKEVERLQTKEDSKKTIQEITDEAEAKEKAKAKYRRPESEKTRYTSSNVTLKSGETVTANFNAKTGKYTDPDSGEDITKDVKTRAGVKKDKPEKEKGVVTALKNKANLSSDDLVKAVKSGSISREEALAIAKAKGIVQ